MSRTPYRQLTAEETATLESQGCSAGDWKRVSVADPFDPRRLQRVRFEGCVTLGVQSGTIAGPDGIPRRCGLYDATVIDCAMGEGVHIKNIRSFICNYAIGPGAVVEDCGKIYCSYEGSSFGNGTKVAVVNEGGGREVEIYEGLSAQVAYLRCFYRHDNALMQGLERIIGAQVCTMSALRGRIGEGAVVSGCGTIENVLIGNNALINNALSLNNGTVCSGFPDYRARVGSGVQASGFIVSAGAEVEGNVQIDNAFVGEAVKLKDGALVCNSLFFANCDCAAGEFVSVFAGPHTVSHHKSSLLIAGYFSFFNAGSGSNQSNHLFKSGPVHQGLHLRGCKFASNAYVMLPAKEGIFNVVLGRHTSHHDTTDLPFSYLLEENGATYAMPGANLRSYGTARDTAKWPRRDRRKLCIDRINYQEWNPYVGEALKRALEVGNELLTREAEVYNYKRVCIKRALLRRGMDFYRTALDACIGTTLPSSPDVTPPDADTSQWVDAAGQLLPVSAVENITAAVRSGECCTIHDLETMFSAAAALYDDAAAVWAFNSLASLIGRRPGTRDISDAFLRGTEAAAKLDELRQDDASKDFSLLMATGYGIDSLDSQTTALDFRAVRKENPR